MRRSTTAALATAPQVNAGSTTLTTVRGTSPSTAPVTPTTVTTGPTLLRQTLGVAIHGSTMSVSPTTATIKLSRSGSSKIYVGVLPTVTVVDARGSLAGWTATVAPTTGLSGADLFVLPNQPVVIAGNEGEVQPAGAGMATPASPAELMRASAEGGGGTFTVDVAVELMVPVPLADAVTVGVAIAVE